MFEIKDIYFICLFNINNLSSTPHSWAEILSGLLGPLLVQVDLSQRTSVARRQGTVYTSMWHRTSSSVPTPWSPVSPHAPVDTRSNL